jgi:tetratricopeptide (TPR) repeat protein
MKAPEAPQAKPGQAAEPRPEYAKAHLKELIARRKHAADASETNSASARRDPQRELREARGLLQGQHFARAEKLLAGLVELEPQNEAYKTYHLWARWRAQPDAAEGSLDELRDLAKKLVAEAEHAGFAAYVLGHVFMHEKRDDLAEKFFKRAHAADRGNKDAERHLVILERRKHTAADGGSGANRKLFGIQLPNSKPKP